MIPKNGELSVSGEELCNMIRLANFFRLQADRYKVREFKSRNHVACLFGNFIGTSSRSRSIQRLVNKMKDLNFLIENDVGIVFFNEKHFDRFVEDHALGREWWQYFSSRVTYVK